MSDDIEHTLFVCRQVNLYRVPPKATAGGHKSGEWKVADKIFTGRLKVTAKGDAAEVRLEDSERYVMVYRGLCCPPLPALLCLTRRSLCMQWGLICHVPSPSWTERYRCGACFR